jgi:hypothetical protein
MSKEKRRYFRINEKVGFSYEWLDSPERDVGEPAAGEQDDEDNKILRLISELAAESPKLAELLGALNAKLDRTIQRTVLESETLTRVVSRIREINISACGLGFINDLPAPIGRHMRCELELSPGEKTVITRGVLVACDAVAGGFYWRVDFYGMSHTSQEHLIQHIVQRQSVQLKNRR